MITCWIQRRRILAHLDRGGPLPEVLARHLADCPKCRAFHSGQVEMERRLSMAAPGLRKEPPPFLEGRILAALKSGTRMEAEGVGSSWPFLPRLATGSVMALLVTGLIWLSWPESQAPLPEQETVAQMAPAPAASGQRMPDLPRLPELGGRFQDPLQQEMNLVMNDARSAADLLARNFIPKTFLAGYTPQE
jgi:hypothetical protein